MPMFDDLRADWGAAAPTNHLALVSPTRRTEFYNHYDGGSPLGLAARPHSACLKKVRDDQRFHQSPSRGWSDIGYNGLVCQHGRAIEGRGIDYVGAHCPDHNTVAYGMQFMVGGDEKPTPAAYARMRRLYDDCVDRSGHPLSKRGHRDGYATACPGDAIYAWVKAGMPTQEDDMPTAKEVADEVVKTLINYPGPDATDGRPRTLWRTIADAATFSESAPYRVWAYPSDQEARTMWNRVTGAAAGVDAPDVTAEQIAAAIPANLAQQVVDALAARLTPKES